ncbi:uncharacterized protein LOC127565761 [Drosophila albomicans]|uniref:MICOS complex subunit MIC13 n=1 Tax=Drosophila albomicans TaxID=7291 RepID=A0A9C6SZR3_DROAB|nr:uncharacterized protein LOC127565761 [Drosophila albomicans]
MILDLVLRTSVVAVVILATRRLNIWDSSDDSVQVYNESRDRARPYAEYACQYLNIHVPDLPPEREKSYLGIYYYNHAVMTIFGFLSMCPTYVHMVAEQIPGIVSEYASRIKEAYDKYQRKRKLEKEKQARQLIIDDKTLVMPLEPRSEANPDCKCSEPNTKDDPGLVPKNAPKSPYSDYCVKEPEDKKSLPDSKCKCPKCDRREAEGWFDNKAVCPKRNPCGPRKCECPRTRIVYTKGSDALATDSITKLFKQRDEILNSGPFKDL